ncbi:MAG TPA: sigma-70 family RNA polymerase sigma factor [Usitatibacter sp.]|nr:sigma-70 family RNA polymerase sigma factor [Usitatibacter sp.]
MNSSRQGKAFEQLVMPHMDAAFNLARWLCGNRQDVEDVTQEALLRAYRFFDALRGDNPRSWLLKIVRNTYYSQWRRARRHDESTEFDEDVHCDAEDRRGDPAFIVSLSQDARRLDAAIAELPVEYREALVLREIEDLSYREIAETLEVPMGTVMSRISRARGLLAQRFGTGEISSARFASSRVQSA